jgi:hypothetical protein
MDGKDISGKIDDSVFEEQEILEIIENVEGWHYNPDETVKCIWCKWEGQLKQAKAKYVCSSRESWRSLAGREGYEFSCPSCKHVVKHDYWRMS